MKTVKYTVEVPAGISNWEIYYELSKYYSETERIFRDEYKDTDMANYFHEIAYFLMVKASKTL